MAISVDRDTLAVTTSLPNSPTGIAGFDDIGRGGLPAPSSRLTWITLGEHPARR